MHGPSDTLASAMCLGTSEKGVPVIYMGEINSDHSGVAMFLDKESLLRLKTWTETMLHFEEGLNV